MNRLDPDTLRKILNQIKRPQNIRSLSRSGIVTLEKNKVPKSTKVPALYRQRRKGNTEEPKIHRRYRVLNRNLPIAYENPSWKYYAERTNFGPLFFESMTSAPFKITKRGKVSTITRPVNVSRLNIKVRRPNQTPEAYLKRADIYMRYMKGSKKRFDIMHEIYKNIMNGKKLNRHSTKDLLLFMTHHPEALMARNRPFYRKKPGVGFVSVNTGRKVTRENIARNASSLYQR